MANADRSRQGEQLSSHEIALVKAMQKLGKRNGFNNQEILSYFSRPGRSINPARIREIETGQRGDSIEPASETELGDFLASFQHPAANGAPPEPTPVPDLPAPDRVGIKDKKIGFIPPGSESDEEVKAERAALIETIDSHCEWFQRNIRTLQIDQSLHENFGEIRDLIAKPTEHLNCVFVFSSLKITRSILNSNAEGLSDQALARWRAIEENASVLLESYPVFSRYRQKAAALKEIPKVDQQDIDQILTVLRSDDAEDVVDQSIPSAIDRLSSIQTDDIETRKQQSLGIQALMIKIKFYLPALSRIIPKIDQNQTSLYNLYRVYSPIVQNVLDKITWWD